MMRLLSRRTVLARMMGFPIILAFPGKRIAKGASREHLVEIRDFRFVPEHLSVKPDDTIRFINRDLAPHTATADDASWSTDELKRGEAGLITVRARMLGDYFCAYHPHMKGKLIVE